MHAVMLVSRHGEINPVQAVHQSKASRELCGRSPAARAIADASLLGEVGISSAWLCLPPCGWPPNCTHGIAARACIHWARCSCRPCGHAHAYLMNRTGKQIPYAAGGPCPTGNAQAERAGLVTLAVHGTMRGSGCALQKRGLPPKGREGGGGQAACPLHGVRALPKSPLLVQDKPCLPPACAGQAVLAR